MDVAGAGDYDDVIQLLREHMQQSTDTDSAQPPSDQTTHPSDQTTTSLRSRVSQVLPTVQWETAEKMSEFKEEISLQNFSYYIHNYAVYSWLYSRWHF